MKTKLENQARNTKLKENTTDALGEATVKQLHASGLASVGVNTFSPKAVFNIFSIASILF